MDSVKNYAFSAMLSRMKYIDRWSLMRNSRTETLSEHTAEVATIAHLLAIIACTHFGETDVNPEKIAVTALYHDASEILTGDLPTPVKYKSPTFLQAYRTLEKESNETLARLLPEELQEEMLPYLSGTTLSAKEHVLLKAADHLSALIKCIEEEASGNTEFTGAKESQMLALQKLNCPAADYFAQHMLPCYAKTLDELTKQ